MNRLETNCTNAVRAWLTTGNPNPGWEFTLPAAAVLAAIPPADWDTKENADMPRFSIKTTQEEEQVFGYGVYSLLVELEITTKATEERTVANAIDSSLQILLSDVGYLDEELTNEHFLCYARTSGIGKATTNGDGKRTITCRFNLVGADLDRFNE